MLRQTSLRHPNHIKKTLGELIDISSVNSRIDVELSTSNLCYPFKVDLPFIIGEISTDVRRGISMLNRKQIDEDVTFGLIFFFTFSDVVTLNQSSKSRNI